MQFPDLLPLANRNPLGTTVTCDAALVDLALV